MRLLSLAVALLLTGCAGQGEPLSEPCRTTTGPITVVVHDTVGDLRVWALGDKRVDTVWHIDGQFLRRPDPPEIHVVKPRDREDTDAMRTWGHELMHFACGRWH